MPTYRIRPGDSLSTIARLHGVPVSDIVASNPQKPVIALTSGATVFASLSVGEDIALPGTVGAYEQLFQGIECQPGYVRDAFGSCVLEPAKDQALPVGREESATYGEDYDAAALQAAHAAALHNAQAPDAASQVPLPPSDLSLLPPCPLPGYARDIYAACRNQNDGRPLASAVMMLGRR